MGVGKARVEVRLTDLAHSLKKAFRPLRAWVWKPTAMFLKIFKGTMVMVLTYELSGLIIL
jgi:hypothetical protein